MPANLTPMYLEAEQRFKRATTPEDRLAALEDMMALIPKHKGTEKLQADIKRKLSQTRKELQKGGKAARRADPSSIPREGAGRIVLVGSPNAGKSALLKALSHAEPEVAPWEFTTREPEQGMVPWEDIQFQMIDIPAISRQFMDYWVMNIVRSADLLLFLVDHAKPGALEDVEEVTAILAEHKVFVDEIESELPRGGVVVPTLLLVAKMDLPNGEENAEVLEEFYGDRFEILRVSAEQGTGLETLKKTLFDRLGILRVYTKQPGKPADMGRPYVLSAGETVEDLCNMVHKDFTEGLKFARVWGRHVFDGQRVNRDYCLEDGDVVELHR